MTSALGRAFGERLRSLRKARRWRQVDLASEAGLSENYISELELGNRDVCLKAQVALAKALNVSLGKLLDGLEKLSDE